MLTHAQALDPTSRLRQGAITRHVQELSFVGIGRSAARDGDGAGAAALPNLDPALRDGREKSPVLSAAVEGEGERAGAAGWSPVFESDKIRNHNVVNLVRCAAPGSWFAHDIFTAPATHTPNPEAETID